jgi:hypothetical protein
MPLGDEPLFSCQPDDWLIYKTVDIGGIIMGARSWTDEQLVEAVKTSNSFCEVSRKLGLSNFGANSRTIKKWIAKLELDVSHFLSALEHLSLARLQQRRLPLDEVFVINSTLDRGVLKRRIIQDNLIPYECQICHINTWQEQKLSLHLDHVNGVNNDNRLHNLRFLCPNCHSLTETYCGKQLRGIINAEDRLCVDCSAPICDDATRCRKCAGLYHNPTRIVWPDHDALQVMVDELGYRGAGKKLGVTDNSVKKRLKNYPKLLTSSDSV